MKRPDMSAWFRSRIDWHTHGMLSGRQAPRPHGVRKIDGDVTDSVVRVTMEDGTQWLWAGGRHSSRKRHGCYPPLMPTPISSR